MSKPWHLRAVSGGRPARRPRKRLGEARLTLIGLCAGLAYASYVAMPGRAGAGVGDDGAGPAHVRVIDGDTFDYRGERIRIADIDTPELDGRCPAEKARAARAAGRMRALLAAGPFELHPLAGGRDEDRYGRKLRIVTRGGRSLGDMLVAEGLARTWTGRRAPWC